MLTFTFRPSGKSTSPRVGPDTLTGLHLSANATAIRVNLRHPRLGVCPRLRIRLATVLVSPCLNAMVSISFFALSHSLCLESR